VRVRDATRARRRKEAVSGRRGGADAGLGAAQLVKVLSGSSDGDEFHLRGTGALLTAEYAPTRRRFDTIDDEPIAILSLLTGFATSPQYLSSASFSTPNSISKKK
jgi:hypothetical protein